MAAVNLAGSLLGTPSIFFYPVQINEGRPNNRHTSLYNAIEFQHTTN